MERPKAKKVKVQQRYRVEYSQTWPCLIASQLSDYHVFCSVCRSDFSIAHGGRDDCRRHIESKKHETYAKSATGLKNLKDFFPKKTEGNEVTNAEMLFTSFLVEHNLPIRSADHAGPLFRAMFPDSKIAKKYSCARTKSTVLIQSMANATQQGITSVLQRKPFSLATDGSNDSGDSKLYPLVVSYFDEAEGKICTLLLTVLECNDNTGEGIFKMLNAELKDKNISWKNCLSFSCDNANTMMGRWKGVAAFVKEVQPSIVIQGCSCHLIHLAAKKAAAELKKVNVEHFFVELYYFLDKSSKRKNCFKLCQELCGTKLHKILKHVSVRWLSLLDAVNRVLEQWTALEHFFCVESEGECLSLQNQIQNPLTKLYLLFLGNVLPVFTTVNTFLQQEAPAVHLLNRKLNELFTSLLIRFVKPSAFSEEATSITDVNFIKRKCQKDDNDLVIGAESRIYIKSGNLTTAQLESFYSEVRNFYVASCQYILKKFPIECEFLKHAEVADVSLRKKVSYASVEFMTALFPGILTSEELNSLDAQFAAYQFECIDENVSSLRMDVQWHEISKITDASGLLKYSSLAKIMLAVLIIPHSNAPTERVFSILRKNHTEFRPSMSSKAVTALLVEKTKSFATGEVCYTKKFSKEVLSSAKRATAQFLNEK